MKTKTIIQNFTRFLKEKKCYKEFFKNFNSQKAEKWRIEQNFCGNTTNFQEWVKELYDGRLTKYDDDYNRECKGSTCALILVYAFLWYTTIEGREFWYGLRNEIRDKYKDN